MHPQRGWRKHCGVQCTMYTTHPPVVSVGLPAAVERIWHSRKFCSNFSRCSLWTGPAAGLFIPKRAWHVPGTPVHEAVNGARSQQTAAANCTEVDGLVPGFLENKVHHAVRRRLAMRRWVPGITKRVVWGLALEHPLSTFAQ